ncbi:DUF1127 domain-containing protein [Xanthobacteraceae bacterium A53D]
MASLGEFSTAVADPFGTRIIHAFNAAGRFLRRVIQAYAHRSELSQLGAMSDSMLRDIGINRSDLRDAAATPWWTDPTEVLVTRAVERRAARLQHIRMLQSRKAGW